MTVIEITAVKPGTVITSNEGRETMVVQPGEPVWKGRRVFMAPDDAARAFDLLQQAFGPEPKGE